MMDVIFSGKEEVLFILLDFFIQTIKVNLFFKLLRVDFEASER